jgi:hypothetical protein
MLKLPESIQKRLASEFRFARDKMAESGDFDSLMYFYSAFYGEVQRALNLHWNADLALMHSVLVHSHQTTMGRLQAIRAGDVSVDLPKGLREALLQVALELNTLFEGDEIDERSLYGILTRIGELTFAMTGNGYYLYVRGAIKI